ncbi:patatin-like phospholipase RssA [Microbulbifer sp. YPW16]|uniref:patatin-like phospholipase RssA n=1 Tax=Microbulbifer sp. YPW16 TaxID=2904242 RepID=UPI001E2E14E9|nr:patatin-like phospholipase RssA [Microbulbifer sp. YPW16]UHQ53979.1 patatin-like phospholipase RssA [Microbulbifer sp. YPW16]
MASSSKPCIGIALGSGAAKGFAHIGVLSALDEMGIRPQVIAGSSMGAFVGSAYAAGCLDKLEEWVNMLDNWRVFSLLDINWTFSGGLIGGKKPFQAFFEGFAYENIEELPVPFTAVATDLNSGQEIWLQEGNLSDAVSASCSIPGLLSPKQVAGRWLVDGAVVNPVPIDVCRAMGATCVIAVDVTEDGVSMWEHRQGEVETLASDGDNSEAPETPAPLQRVNKEVSAGVSLEKLLTQGRQQLAQIGDRFTRTTPYAPGMLETMSTSMEILERRHKRSRLAGSPPDIMIIPKVGGIGGMEFSRAAEAVAAGRAEVERVKTWIEDVVPANLEP